MKKIEIAIAGNPNCGKTTLFNALTGARQQVGNWPGVTVERIEGEYRDGDVRVHATDLPGIYSFSAFSIDEQVARDHILSAKPHVVVNILDATNIERNLYLTTQLLEMRVPIVVALSMSDVARRRRIKIEVEHLARHLGCPVIPIVATKGSGLDALKAAIRDVAERGHVSPTRVEYDSELEEAIASISSLLEPEAAARGVDARWLTLKLLEQDEVAHGLLDDTAVAAVVEQQTARVEHHTGEEMDIVIADGRYGFIHGLSRDVVRRDNQVRQSVSEAIDRVLLHRVLGIPLFLGVMYLVFYVTINVGAPFIDFFDQLFGTIFVDGFRFLLEGWQSPAWLTALLADGVGAGIQTVSTFIPPIFLIFLCLSILEDSGYMSRAAFVMDRFLRTIGLPGKAFIPMLVGFGCNVPAIMATRTLENNRDRVLTILMNPFMSCGARLPVYTLFVAAFFTPQQGGAVLFGIYLTGIVLSVLTGLLFKQTILSGTPSSFVMELPPYHMPALRGVLFHTWTRLRAFILKAGRAILMVVVILSFFNAMGTDGGFDDPGSESSVLSAASRKVGPVFEPMGLTEENWPGSVGLFMGLFAKEAVVGTLDALYAQMESAEARVGEPLGSVPESLGFWDGIIGAFAAIPEGFRGEEGEASESELATVDAMVRYFDGKVGALAYLLFVLIYAPCVSAIAAIYGETNFRWTVFAVGYLTSLAWVVSTLFYQLGRFVQHPARSTGWVAVCLGVLVLGYALLKWRGVRMAGRDVLGDRKK